MNEEIAKLNPKMRKAEAKALFIDGNSPKMIAELLGMNSPESISNWARKEDWYSERDAHLQRTTNDRLQDLMEHQERVIQELQVIRNKAFESIENGNVAPARYSEAANAYLASLDMERKIKLEALQISFINDVANILKEEISDKGLLIKIARRFRALFETYQAKVPSEGKKVPEASGEENAQQT